MRFILHLKSIHPFGNMYCSSLNKVVYAAGSGFVTQPHTYLVYLEQFYRTDSDRLGFPRGGIGGSRGGREGRTPPPWASKFFRFHAVFGKIWRVHAPPGGFTPPPSGKSWIRHWGAPKFAKNCMKMKKIGRGGRRASKSHLFEKEIPQIHCHGIHFKYFSMWFIKYCYCKQKYTLKIKL